MEKFLKKENKLMNEAYYQKIAKRISLFIVLLIFSGFIFPQSLFSQGISKILFDSKGTDFWLAFPPNFHNNYKSDYEELRKGDSLYIFIVADEPTIGKIEYKDRHGNPYSQDFIINDPKKIHTFKVTHWDFEVTGFNQSGKILDKFDINNQCEVVGINSFHITSDNEITVYAHSQAVTTSDAFLVLPTDVLGKEYIVLSYNSHGTADTVNIYEQSTPSQFLIVASEDSTNVSIISSTEFYRNGRNNINISLNKGEVFLVQARITNTNLRGDLTGTEVTSDRPIALFSGHQRTILPIYQYNFTSRDCLIEQMLPIKTWGKNAFIVPYVLPYGATDVGNDLYRVLFSENNTDLYINGDYEGSFDRGEYFEQAINSAVSLEATYAILVAQYKKTAQGDGSVYSPDSDPFMMLVPPKEQFMDEYNVINTQAWESEVVYGEPSGSYNKVYNDHYIAVVVHKNDLTTTQIDNIIIARSEFTQIPSSDYYYANVSVSEGSHKVKSGGRIGVYVYGYGYANSYGYVGGLSMLEFDFKKPRLLTEDSCYKLEGMAFDSSSTDSKLKTLTNDNSKNVNVKVEVEKFSALKDSAFFRAQLINKYADGSFVISAKDSVGLDSTKVFEIPGFTIAIDSIGPKDSVIYLKGEYRTSKQICKYFNLKNYGKFEQKLMKLYFKNDSIISTNISAPFILKSKEEIPLEVCFSFESDTLITDTLSISDGCGERKILVLNLTFISDKNDPQLLLTKDSCNRFFDVKITENHLSDWGLKEVEINPVQNCKVTTISRDPFLAKFTIDVLDYDKDAIFYIIAEDSIGNKVMRYDTIQGFTLGFPQFGTNRKLLDYGIEKISYINCDTLILENSGLLPFVINSIYLKHNIHFSIPKSSFPLVIEPAEIEEINVCFQPTNIYQTFRDTMVVSFNCIDKLIALEGVGDSLIHYGEADCGVIIKTVSYEIDPKYLLDANLPNPVINFTSFNFQIPEDNFVTLEIFDLMGNRKKELINTWITKGYYSKEFDLSDLSQGMYIYIIKTQNNIMRGQLIKL